MNQHRFCQTNMPIVVEMSAALISSVLTTGLIYAQRGPVGTLVEQARATPKWEIPVQGER